MLELDLDEINASYSDSLDDVDKWIKEEYESNFGEYFSELTSFYEKLNETNKPITDRELEHIMSSIPLKLFSAAEALNSVKAKVEVLKINNKTLRKKIMLESEAKTKQAKEDEADVAVSYGEILVKLYSTLIDRVERQMSYSRELIMSAKKIWTARKEEEVNARLIEPTSPAKTVNPPLPDYGGPIPSTYIQ